MCDYKSGISAATEEDSNYFIHSWGCRPLGGRSWGEGGGCMHSYYRLAVVLMEENQRRQRAGSQGESVQKIPSRAVYGHSSECLTPFLYSHHPPTLSSHLSASFQPTLHHPPVPWHFRTKATRRNRHACIENQINMSLLWPWGEVSNISFQGNNDSSFNSPYFTVCPNEYTAWVILIEHQPASGIMTLTLLSRYDDLMTMDLLIYPEICSTFFMKT